MSSLQFGLTSYRWCWYFFKESSWYFLAAMCFWWNINAIRKNIPANISALPTIPATASTWTGCNANSNPVTHTAKEDDFPACNTCRVNMASRYVVRQWRAIFVAWKLLGYNRLPLSECTSSGIRLWQSC